MEISSKKCSPDPVLLQPVPGTPPNPAPHHLTPPGVTRTKFPKKGMIVAWHTLLYVRTMYCSSLGGIHS